ncbi:hypothetical protein T484DRAFT_1917120 [Baffinella frigidus]|nr:hypothetical protein T484DRAFT_1917120 [Cryptophyta sp. CCMP2293]
MTHSLTPTLTRTMPTLGRKKEGAGHRQQRAGTMEMVANSEEDDMVGVLDGGCEEIDEEGMYLDEDFEAEEPPPLPLPSRRLSIRRGSPPPDDDVEDTLNLADMGRDEPAPETREPGFSFVGSTPRGVTDVEPEQTSNVQRRHSRQLEDEIGEEEGLAPISRRDRQPVAAAPPPPPNQLPAQKETPPLLPEQAHRKQGQEEAATRPPEALPTAGRGRGKGAPSPKEGGPPVRKGGAGRGRDPGKEPRVEAGGNAEGAAPQEGAGDGAGRGRGRGRGAREDLGVTKGKGFNVPKAERKQWRPREEEFDED